ncbi:MAG: demethoxyubiquinone hydroxylase family protein [Pseudomonadota bacterium]
MPTKKPAQKTSHKKKATTTKVTKTRRLATTKVSTQKKTALNKPSKTAAKATKKPTKKMTSKKPAKAATKTATKKATAKKAVIKKTRPAPTTSTPADIASMIRVDHAGEFGAKRIYQGQIAILGDTEYGDVLRHMAEQEEEHFDTFTRMIQDRGVRPSLFHPFWDLAGYALGAGTALMGVKAAMACTVAVEEVIEEHYNEQEEQIGDRDPELTAKIQKFREDELEHRDLGLEHDAELAPAYRVLYQVIRTGSHLAIWVAKRF